MGTRSPRTLPVRETPVIGPDGRMTLDWYNYFVRHEAEHGGSRFDRLVRSPEANNVLLGGSGVAGAAGTVTLTIDGVDYQVVFE